MNYIETILLIEKNGEHVLAQDIRAIISTSHRYLRDLDSLESSWHEDNEPGAPEKRFGRGGAYYVWNKQEMPDDKPLILPEGT